MASKKRGGLGKGLDSLIPVQSTRVSAAAADTEGAGDRSRGTGAERQTNGAGSEGGAELVRMIRVTRIEPDREQPRRNFKKEELEELTASIKTNGLLEPIIVQEEDGRYVIIAGERRWRASQAAGLKEIPAIVKHYTPQERVEISLIENIQREDLNPIEEANAYKRLSEEFGLKQEEIAEKVSKSRTAVTNTMRLLKLTDAVQKMVVDGKLSMGHARALIPVEDPQQQESLAEKIVSEELSVRDVEKLIKESAGAQKRSKKEVLKDPSLEVIYRDLETKMKQSLGMKVDIISKGNGGKVEITFSGADDLEKLMERILQ